MACSHEVVIMADNMQNSTTVNKPRSESWTWRPLLTGDTRTRALETVRAIAGHLRDRLPADIAANASLGGGQAGIALFFAYLHRCLADPGAHAAAVQLLEQATDALAAQPSWISLYAGFSGVAWAGEHLGSFLFEPGGDDPNEDVDETLHALLSQGQWGGDYDLIRGLVGLGVYALERLPNPVAAETLERIVAHLANSAERRPDGATWWTDPRWLPPEDAANHPHGYYNLGVAHGVPGVIALLGAACAAGLGSKLVRDVLADAVAWVLAQRQSVDGVTLFPLWVENDTPPAKSRLAWCYGDAGVAAALFWAGRHVGEPAWEGAALEIALRAAEQAPEQTGVVDAGLCHGAAGLGHLFNRLAQASANDRLAVAARFWFDLALAMRRPGQGVGGYQAWGPAPGGGLAWWDDATFLTGSAGIGLSLLAATTDVEPRWDRVLLAGPFSGERVA